MSDSAVPTNLLNAAMVSPHEALEAAYRLGKFDGMLDVMNMDEERKEPA